MPFPLISEYIEAIKSAEDNFDELSYLRPVLDADGQPVMSSGNFAVVFKMKDVVSGNLYALKCFTKEQEGRAQAYHQIADALKDVDSPYLVSLHYLDKELFVDTEQTSETEFPVLLMDWVEGKTLDKYLRENLDDKYSLEMLAYRFSQLAQWLIPQPIAHGDLKPDNILVREDGTLVLVDYDGMYVPAMKGQKARELGSPDFRHPLRTENDFDEHIDEFPLVSILLSLKAISYAPKLLEKYGMEERLLLSKHDYLTPNNSTIINLLFSLEDTSIKVLTSNLILVLETNSYLLSNNINGDSLDLFGWNTEHEFDYLTTLQTTFSDEELKDSIRDEENLVIYDNSGYKLLKAYDCFIDHYDDCYVRDGCKIICDNAFSNCPGGPPQRIWLPNSIIRVGNEAFTTNCSPSISEIIVSDGQKERFVKMFPNYRHLIIEKSLMTEATINDIDNGEKDKQGCVYSKDGKRLLHCSLSWERREIHINDGTLVICDKVFLDGPFFFQDLSSHMGITTSPSLLSHVYIPNSVQIIGCAAFYGCSSLENINMPNSVTRISSQAFWGSGLKSIEIPESVVFIDDFAFASCFNLYKVKFLAISTIVSDDVFYDSYALQVIEVPMGTKEYYSKALPKYSHIIFEWK